MRGGCVETLRGEVVLVEVSVRSIGGEERMYIIYKMLICEVSERLFGGVPRGRANSAPQPLLCFFPFLVWWFIVRQSLQTDERRFTVGQS